MTMVKLHSPAQRNLNNFFDEFFNELPAFGKTVNNLFSPAVNILETADGYHMELNVPGRNKEDFNITVDKGLLSISYEKKEEAKNDDVKVVRREFSYQSFKRSFTVDEKINAEAIQAKYENGLLKLFLPKKADVQQPVKTINIQ
ncbi:Hsp20/alpha crystallin family protein [Lacibacter luteus]|uniref:Hsp20/alpha crystallin family protein n=1 Tax=Lacibacter luteus TaxID=2508719 RepID=A0A4Q1CG51_9BACT|nr:Hsp20/alpha crystallin family protein [Lacibacter luteus]RXK58989.1 Hsp20/alpha crystallin family protein [Lacibacter luteus]